MSDDRHAWITGIGLVSSLGEGVDAHWQALQEGRVNVDVETFAPYMVHPIAPMNFDLQIPKKGDQRQMEAWQRIGTYAAGLALDSAGLKGNTETLARMDMMVAADGGERDLTVDSAILTEYVKGQTSPARFNEKLMGDLRPTLFLAQLSNLLAGNISIVHGVTGSSRTFMGEEGAGIDVVRIALARIAAGQSDIVLIGAAHNGERKDMLMLYEFGGFNLKEHFAPIWKRGTPGGLALGSGGAFLVIESAKHARSRGAKPFARLASIDADHSRRREDGAITATLRKLWKKVVQPGDGKLAVLTGATGAQPATAEERAFLDGIGDVAIRETGTQFGHLMGASFPLNIALGALCLSHGALFPPKDAEGAGIDLTAAPSHIAVIGTGHWRGEGIAMLEAVN